MFILNQRQSPDTTESVVEIIMTNLPTTDELDIDIRRSFLLVDALREGRKRKFGPSKQLKVTKPLNGYRYESFIC